MAKDSMTFKLFGRDVSLSKTFNTAGKNAGKFGKDGSKALGGIAMAGAGLAGVGLAAAAFAGKSIGAFQQVGGESLKLQRYMGGTIEDASRLGHVAAMTGIDSESMAKSMGVLSKNLVANSAVAKGLGVSYRDANGDMLPMTEILPQLADKFAGMEAGPEKTALALKLFGKQGMNMLPMLNKGAEGIKALTAESDALGTTLTDKDAQAVKDATANKRKMSQAVKGLQISIGKNLLPIVQTFVTWMTTKVVPAVKDVVGFLERNKAVVVGVASVLVPLVGGMFAFVKVMQVVAALTKAWAVAQLILNSAFLANPLTWVVIGIVALVAAIVIAYKRSETFRNIVQGALRAVGAAFTWLKDKAVAAFQWIKTKGWDFLVSVIKNSPLGLQIRAAFAAFKWFRDKIGGVVTWIIDKWDDIKVWFKTLPEAISRVADRIQAALVWPFKMAFNLISKAWNATIGGLSFSIPDWVKFTGNPIAIALAGKSVSIPRAPEVAMAVGGLARADGMAMLHKGEVVMPYERAMGIERGSGGPTVVIQGGTFIGTDLRRAARELNAALRADGARGLVTA
jgi:hypothetical protein